MLIDPPVIVEPLTVPVNVPLVAVIAPVIFAFVAVKAPAFVTLNGAVEKLLIPEPDHIFPALST